MPSLTVIAGPNGSGKSTFAQVMKLETIDPDRLAAGYGQGFTREANLRASREALQLIQDRLASQQSFVVETTLAARQPLRLMIQARAAGYHVQLVFIVVDGDTRLRIDNRVLRGGHNIADADLERRGPRLLVNLPEAVEQAHITAISLSGRRTRDFTLVGVVNTDECLLTPAVPAEVRAVLAARLEVRDVETLLQSQHVHTLEEAFERARVRHTERPERRSQG